MRRTRKNNDRTGRRTSGMRAIVLLVVVVMIMAAANSVPPKSVLTEISQGLSEGKPVPVYPTMAESTGADLHLEVCGQTWEEYYSQLPQNTSTRPIQWTVSGGDEYRKNAEAILSKWRNLGLDPVLVVAMDNATASTVCENGFQSVYWSATKASYSLVADAKFGVAAALAEKGYLGFFIEMDVFCRENPVPMFLQYEKDLINIGHGDVANAVNIGVFMASSRMGPWFQGLKRVLAYSLERETYINGGNSTADFFDQAVYQHCLPYVEAHDDDFGPLDEEYYHADDFQMKNNLLKSCQEMKNFDYKTLPHHLMSSHDPPTIYDSTYCIHPLAGMPFTPLAFKMGVAKFFGWDPKSIGAEERLVKLYAGDFELNNCWNRVLDQTQKQLDDWSAQQVVAQAVASMVEIALATNRTLVLPRYIWSKDAWAFPTHAIVDVRTLGVPYRFLTQKESHAMNDVMHVLQASQKFEETLAESLKFGDAKVLSINKLCTVRDNDLPKLEKRKRKIKWCLDIELEWSRAAGGFMEFCNSER